jgi:hypothetical protein
VNSESGGMGERTYCVTDSTFTVKLLLLCHTLHSFQKAGLKAMTLELIFTERIGRFFTVSW